jgi:glutamate synthase (NADPH/NADH) small chain
MDAVRTSHRLGAKRAIICYRRTEAECQPVLKKFITQKKKVLSFSFSMLLLNFVGDENGNLREMVVQKMQLGEPDASGRRRPVPIP